MRLGRPKAKEPSCSTDSPLIWPTSAPSVSTSTTPRLIVSCARSRRRSARWICSSMARATSCARGHLALRLARPVVGLAHEVGNAADLDRQLLAIVGQARAFVDDARHAGRIERLQPVLLDDRGDQARVGVVVLARARDGVVEVGLHLEEAGEVRIVRGQQVVELAIAEQDHLHVERNGLGVERSASTRGPIVSAGCSMRISRALMARLSASQANGDSSSLRASSSR